MLKNKNTLPTDFEFIDQSTKKTIPNPDTPDFFNDFYANVGTRKFPILNTYDDEKIDCEPFEIGDVTLQEVSKLILGIDITKDSCVNGINAKILKAALLAKSEALLHLFKESLSQGIFS